MTLRLSKPRPKICKNLSQPAAQHGTVDHTVDRFATAKRLAIGRCRLFERLGPNASTAKGRQRFGKSVLCGSPECGHSVGGPYA